MNGKHHQMARPGKIRRSRLKQETVLGTLAAFSVFGLIYAYSGNADLYYPFASALGMGAVVYAVAWLTARRNLWP